MKFFTFTLGSLLLAISELANAQTPNWQWAQSLNINENYPPGQYVTSDANGNAYITGTFEDSAIAFGNIILTNTGSSGTNSIYIVKYDSLGNVVWAINSVGNGDIYFPFAYVYGICTDRNSNIYVTGDFSGNSISFNGKILASPFPNTDDYSFMMKLNSSGDVTWIKPIGNAKETGICTDVVGNIYITGSFFDTSSTVGNITLSKPDWPNSGPTLFIAKFDPAGSVVWAKGAGTGINDYTSGISTDAAGNVYATGVFSSLYIGFDNDSVSNLNAITNEFASNIFTVALNSSGSVLWLRGAGGNSDDQVTGISADADGNVYLAGTMYSDSMVFGNLTVFNSGMYDIFVVKYSNSGDFAWVQNVSGTNYYDGAGIGVDASGDFYIDGPISVYGVTSSTAALPEIFVAKFDPDGNLIWRKGAQGYSSAGNLSVNAADNIYLAGIFYSPEIVFEPAVVLVTGNQSLFLAKLSMDTPAITVSGNISMFPNPTTGSIYFTGTGYGNQLEIFNMLGQLVYSSTTTGDNSYINLSGKESGTYIYRITDKDQVLARGKFILLKQPAPQDIPYEASPGE